MSNASIAINGQDVVQGDNSAYSYSFPISVSFPRGTKVALQSLSMFYSWPNITANYNNNSFSFRWTNGTVIQVQMADGFYSVPDINAYLQSILVANNMYLINSTGDYVYYLEIVENPSRYAIQFNSYPLPTALPAGWTAPVGFPAFPLVASTPQFIIPNTNITRLFGLNAGTYPPVSQTTAYSKLSDFTPQVNTVSSVYLLCSLVANRLAVPNSILYQFSASGTVYGGLISITPPFLVYNNVYEGNYPNIRIQFVDQNFNPLPLLDTNIGVLLAIQVPE